MSTCTALNTEPMMKSIPQHHQTQTQNSSSTSPTTATTVTDTSSDVIAPHETNVQGPTTFSDVFSRFECKLNHFHSAIQTPRARTATLTTVDQDIDAAKRLVLPILTRRNMLTPISILPAEILAHIFHFNAFSEQPYSPTPTLGWVYVTHVCRHWRQVALDNSMLWTHFSISGNKDWIVERLSRARNAPLVIDVSGLVARDMFSLFTPHISHTRELCLHNLSLFHLGFFQEFSIQNALTLERVDLRMTSPMDIKHLGGHLFFKGPLPKLRIFSISQILFPWSLVPRGQLTQLKVVLNKEDLTSQPEVSSRDGLNELVDLLVNCPSLEVLILENCLPAALSESSGGQTIHLPGLLRLYLGGSSSRVTNLLKMLKLPSSTTLRLNCTPGYSATLDQHLILLLILSAHFNDPTPTEFRSFEINLSHGSRMLNVFASTSLPTSPISHTYVIQAATDIDAELGLSLSFPRVDDLSNVVDMILKRTCDLLPLSKLEFLSILSAVSTQAINWGELFRHCTEVSTVQVYGQGTTGLLQALTPPQHSQGKGRKTRRGDDDGDTRGHASNDDNDNDVTAPVQVPIFPKLTTLLLETLNFSDMVPGSGALFDLVLSAVKRRKAKKTPLSTLRITQCVISAEGAATLEKIVRDFQWDHHREGNEEEDEYDEADDHDCQCYDYNGFDYDDDISNPGVRYW